MRGIVLGLQARVQIVLRLPDLPDFAVECVLDTGFAGALTLPPEAVAKLNLPFVQNINANLADGGDVKTSVHRATVVWNGEVLNVAVLALGIRPLLGTALLDGKNLNVDFVEGGQVQISDVF